MRYQTVSLDRWRQMRQIKPPAPRKFVRHGRGAALPLLSQATRAEMLRNATRARLLLEIIANEQPGARVRLAGFKTAANPLQLAAELRTRGWTEHKDRYGNRTWQFKG